jgi:hypothetical protein
MDVSQDYGKIKTRYSRENYTDSCMRNNIVKYKVESSDLEATRDQDKIGDRRCTLNLQGKGKQTYLYY